MIGATVCASLAPLKMGGNFLQLSGRMPLRTDVACTVLSSGDQSERRFYLPQKTSSIKATGELGRAANINCCIVLVHRSSSAGKNRACKISSLSLGRQKLAAKKRQLLM